LQSHGLRSSLLELGRGEIYPVNLSIFSLALVLLLELDIGCYAEKVLNLRAKCFRKRSITKLGFSFRLPKSLVPEWEWRLRKSFVFEGVKVAAVGVGMGHWDTPKILATDFTDLHRFFFFKKIRCVSFDLLTEVRVNRIINENV
jgi:hypothetical protein